MIRSEVKVISMEHGVRDLYNGPGEVCLDPEVRMVEVLDGGNLSEPDFRLVYFAAPGDVIRIRKYDPDQEKRARVAAEKILDAARRRSQ